MDCNECMSCLRIEGHKVALMSDIHSNYHAFKACYEDAVKCGAACFIFLGDYISDLAEPQKTMDLVYKIQADYPTVVCAEIEKDICWIAKVVSTALFRVQNQVPFCLHTIICGREIWIFLED